METFNADQFTGGWFVGAFYPTAYHTAACEVSYKTHHAGEYWTSHYHKESDEINYLIRGRMSINDIELSGPIVFVIKRNEISRPVFHTDVELIVVKTPSIPGDKFEVID